MIERKNPGASSEGSMQDLLNEVAGAVDLSGLELARLVHAVANQYDGFGIGHSHARGFSGPRWRLLFRLMAEERGGRTEGLSPSYLSRCQNVGKNTISVLIRGLEEQGMVERTLDQDDRRFYRIRLTDAGRQQILQRAPVWLMRLNDLASDLSSSEKAALIHLLTQLHGSLVRRVREPAAAPAAGGDLHEAAAVRSS